MERDLGKKIKKLGRSIQKLEDVLAAFPTDSDDKPLLRICREELGERAVAVTMLSKDYPKQELSFARRVTHVVSGPHREVPGKKKKKR
jgi:PP-loop superfamily ATP-utilizing enzyme